LNVLKQRGGVCLQTSPQYSEPYGNWIAQQYMDNKKFFKRMCKSRLLEFIIGVSMRTSNQVR
jgi:hypothetical protein